MVFSELVTEGLNLLVIGMGTVFVFLALMVVVVMMMSRMVQWIESRQSPLQQTLSPSSGGVNKGHDAEHIAAITTAVQRYRDEHSS